LTTDQIGSTRLVTDANANVISRHDFLPFGEDIGSGYGRTDTNQANAGWGRLDSVSQLFTGQYRDWETRLDYFNARYMNAMQGRFLSPDPSNAGANPLDPQTWNAYSYVRNRPTALTDPSGMCSSNVFNGTYEGSGSGFPCYDASIPSGANPYEVTSSGGASVSTGSYLGSTSPDLTAAQSSYADNVQKIFNQKFQAAWANRSPNFKAIGNTFAAVGSHLPLDNAQDYQVNFEIRGTTYNIQILDPTTDRPYDINAFDNWLSGTVDPLAAFHGGNSSEYFGSGAFNVLHVANVTEAYGQVRLGLDAHIDAFNPMANPGTFVLHNLIEVIPFYFNAHGMSGTVTCSVMGGCHR
jgi:RHS repeat-associated protein